MGAQNDSLTPFPWPSKVELFYLVHLPKMADAHLHDVVIGVRHQFCSVTTTSWGLPDSLTLYGPYAAHHLCGTGKFWKRSRERARERR